MAKLNVRKGDAVKVISGKEKGKTGQISKVDTTNGRVTIDGLNMVIKHVKPKKAQEKGGRIDQPSSIDSSNVMILCNACGLPTRVGNKTITKDNGKEISIRICKKCGASLEVTAKKSTVKKATKKAKATKAKAVSEAKAAEVATIETKADNTVNQEKAEV